jgi:long-chain fatty acid transport protein
MGKRWLLRGMSCAVLGCVVLNTAQAGGLWLSEYNQPGMGRAAAGQESGSGDASDAFFNPASMSRHEQSQLMVGGGVAWAQIEFDVEQGSLLNGNGDGGDAGGLVPSASVFYSHPVDERLTFGIAGLALTGSTLDYDDDWVGRFQSQDVSLLVLGAVPSFGYRVTDRLSLGLALPVMYSSLEMDIAVPALVSQGPDEGKAKIDGNDTQVAGSASFLYEISEATRIGGRITSRFDFKYDGEVQPQFIDSVAVNTNLGMAALARVGLSHRLDARWTLYGSIGWENWSEMDEVFLSTESEGVALPYNWKDTWHTGFGVDYAMNASWTLRAGMAYDSDPTDAEDRTADMPIDEQYRFAVGADNRREDGSVISYSLVYADYGDAEIDNIRVPALVGFSGQYKSNEILFFSVSWNMPRGTLRQ